MAVLAEQVLDPHREELDERSLVGGLFFACQRATAFAPGEVGDMHLGLRRAIYLNATCVPHNHKHPRVNNFNKFIFWFVIIHSILRELKIKYVSR